MKTVEQILSTLPDYAKDIKLNLSSLVNNHSQISDTGFYGTVLASAYASKNKELIVAIEENVKQYLDEATINGVKAAAAIMAMTNIYYRFTDLVENENYSKMPAGLRMNIIRDHGIDKTNFEMYCLAVSIINGCSKCVSSHEKQLVTSHNVSPEAIQLIAKIAAVIHALARTLDTISY